MLVVRLVETELHRLLASRCVAGLNGLLVDFIALTTGWYLFLRKGHCCSNDQRRRDEEQQTIPAKRHTAFTSFG
jgi:hypothetical protein